MNSIQTRSKLIIFLLIIIVILTSGCIVDYKPQSSNQQNITSSPVPATLVQVSALTPFRIQAEKIIRNFTGSPELNLMFKGIRNYTYADLYGFDSGNYSFWVNNATGRVQSMSFDAPDSKTQNDILNLDMGLPLAESYAKEKCPEFWENETGKLIKMSKPTAKDHELAYSWRQYFVFSNSTSSDSPEIAGFNLIDVILDARDGKIKSYHEWYVPRDKNLNLNPELSEDQAWETVKKYFEETGIGTLDATQRNNLGLVISIDDNNIQHLGWQFEIKKSEINPNYYGGQIIVDAHNGQIIRHIRFG